MNEGRCIMFPVINKRETGLNLRRIMDKCGLSAKDVQELRSISFSRLPGVGVGEFRTNLGQICKKSCGVARQK